MTRDQLSDDGFSLIEILVVIAILGVVSAATFTVVLTTMRTERFTSQVKDTTDDARVSIERIRQQVRQARLIESGSTAQGLRFWLDADQDARQTPDEIVCYFAAPVTGVPDRYELKRWNDDVASCATGYAPPPNAYVLARTLRNTDVFSFSTATVSRSGVLPPDSSTDPVRQVHLKLGFDVVTDTGPEVYEVTSTVRLRNVP